MNWNKLLIVYSKYVLILTRFVLLGALVFVVVSGDRYMESHMLPVQLDLSGSTSADWSDQIKVRSGYEDSVVNGRVHLRNQSLRVEMSDSVFTGGKVQLLIMIVWGILLTHFLLGIVKSSATNSFFSAKNLWRVRFIGFSLIVYSFIEYGFEKYRAYLIDRFFESDFIEATNFSVNILPSLFDSKFVIGVIVLIVAQAFDHGLKLEREQELTV